LPAVDLWQEFVDLSSIHSHDLIVAEEHAAADAAPWPDIVHQQ